MGLIPSSADSLGIALLIVDFVFIALAAIAILLRVWARRIQKASLCLNDYAVMVAWVSTAFFSLDPDSRF